MSTPHWRKLSYMSTHILIFIKRPFLKNILGCSENNFYSRINKLNQWKYVLYCHLLIHAEIYINILDKDRRNDKDALRKPSLKIFTSHFIARVRKGCVGFYWERELETEHNWNILTPKLWPSALCLSCSRGLLNRRPRAHSAR